MVRPPCNLTHSPPDRGIVVSDVSILVLPLFKVWSLKLSNKHKIGVSSVFVTGVL
jgi:hypothetical protein